MALSAPPKTKRNSWTKARILEAGRFTRLDDGITTDQARRLSEEGRPLYPFSLQSYYRWCIEEVPLLGRTLRHECRDSGWRKDKLFISRSDLDEIMAIRNNPFNRRLPGNPGVWIADGILQRDDGELALTVRYILDHVSDVVPRETWFDWVKSPCPELDPKNDDGKIPHCLVLWPPEPEQRIVVLEQKIVRRVIERRKQQTNAQPPGEDGEWLTDEIYQDEEGLWFTDPYAAPKYEVSDMTLVYYRRKPHTALDPSINEGKLRSKKLPKLTRTAGKSRVVVSFQGDLDEIDAFRKEQKRRASEVKVPEGHLPISGLAAKLGVKTRDQKRSLGFALQMFHSEHPSASELFLLWDDKRNRAVETSHYDVVRFLAWMDGSDVVELLKERNDRPQRNEQRHAKRLAKADSFLKVLLAEGPIVGTEVKREASKAGVARKTLWESKKSLGVESFSTAFQGPSYWRLPKDEASENGNGILVDESLDLQGSPPAEAETPPTTPPEEPTDAKRKRGRTPSRETQRVHEYCWRARRRGVKRLLVKSRANKFFGRDVIKRESHVTTYAGRFKPPWHES